MKKRIRRLLILAALAAAVVFITGIALTFYEQHLVSYPEELKGFLLNHPKSDALRRNPDYFLEFQGPKASAEISVAGFAKAPLNLKPGQSLLVYDDSDNGLIYLYFDDKGMLFERRLARKNP